MAFLDIFSKKKNTKEQNQITIDYREKNSQVPEELEKLNFKINYKNLTIGDYTFGKTTIERKTISDLKQSIIKKRIFKQIEGMQQYKSKLLIVEGKFEDLFNNIGLSKNAMVGFLLSLITENKCPFIFSYDSKETANIINLLFKKTKRTISLRPSKRIINKKEKQIYILEGFSGIGRKTAEKLISEFKTLKNIFSSSKEDLEKSIGNKTKKFIEELT